MFNSDGLPFTRHSDVLNADPVEKDDVCRLVEEIKRRGNAAFQQKSLQEADVLYSKGIQCDSENCSKNVHMLYANRAAAKLEMGKVEEALKDAESSINMEPKYTKGYFRKAQSLAKLCRHKEALDVLDIARNLEPENKSVSTLYKEISDSKMNCTQESMNGTTTQTQKKSTIVRTESVKQPKNEVKTQASTGHLAEDDENLSGSIRGYKQLADGRVTTFFHNELDDQTKELIGDIAPKLVKDPNAVQIKSVEGASAWNQGNTFEEKNMTAWAKEKIEALLQNLSVTCQAAPLTGQLSVVSVTDLNGDASIAVVRGSKRYIYEFTFRLKCSLAINGTDEKVEGYLKYLDFSSDNDDYDEVEVDVPSRYQTEYGKALHASLASTSSPLRQEVAKRLALFEKEYHTF
uniref:Hsp90like protein putative n=1 Tax=Albugo laibachii Nc14 TaxID=890382 RepID=F0WQ61_9STRA|nr:hsp90like protein putative [Albugo laibachii Nc14]|eukprot:CCA23467.1 hsp90like protein putative [Albugo laibachii Nc14]